MKKLFFVFALVTLSLKAQSITLPDKWLFQTGDDISYSQIDFDDSKWHAIDVPANWENRGYQDYDGYAWYRVHFQLKKNEIRNDLYLLAGKIDDVDETYLNGVLIGSKGKFPPEAGSAWNEQRGYKIPKGLLKEKNILAVRVYDGQGGGGIYGGLIGILKKSDYIKALNLKPAPKKSFFQISTSNGLICAVYNEVQNEIESVSPHIFQMYDLDKPVKSFVKHIKLPDNFKPVKVYPLENSHIIRAVYKNFKVDYFAPFTLQKKVFIISAKGRKQEIENIKFTHEKGDSRLLTGEYIIDRENNEAEKFFLFTFNDSKNSNGSLLEAVSNKKVLDGLTDNELKFMKNIFSSCRFPKEISTDERSLYEQSIAILKMSQVSQDEVFPKSRGQILASLSPGNWNIGWLRDGCYAILALDKLGLYEEAKNALLFFLNADAGYYKHFKWKDSIDYGVKTDYRLSVCRYFGIGKEESDFNENGPNIELDGFGLFLTAFSDYINKSGDKDLLKKYYDEISDLIANPILTFIDENNLIRIESGPWEIHLPGKQQAFTSIANSAGLRNYAELLKENGYTGYEKYFATAEKLKHGIEENLIYNNKLLKGFAEAKSPIDKGFYDGGVIEAFTQNVFTDKKLFESNFAEYDKALRKNKKHGFSRLSDPDWYTISEWPFIDLRFSMALKNFGMKRHAKQLIDWITNYSKLNHNYIAELYNAGDENYGGAIPMVGYGAGAYILAVNNYYGE